MAQSAEPTPVAGAVLLSESTDGNYVIRKYAVSTTGDEIYTVRYPLSAAQLSGKVGDNTSQLDALGRFIGELPDRDQLAIRSISVTGYSSPDGPVKLNEALASRRAADLKAYLDKTYDLSNLFGVKVSSVAEDWKMCRALVEQSEVPDKEKVLAVIDGEQSPEAKERALKRMPAAWKYLKANVLPSLRRAELTIAYEQTSLAEQRTRVPRVVVVPVAVVEEPAPCCCAYHDDGTTGIIVAVPGAGPDYDCEYCEEAVRHDLRQANRTDRQADHILKKVSRKERKADRRSDRSIDKR